ncbi:unnamed protein product [Pedinophyceae sp. YPF-701]|nr:unnamed protein product [Pedinophyceae sp. YPF-701]
MAPILDPNSAASVVMGLVDSNYKVSDILSVISSLGYAATAPDAPPLTPRRGAEPAGAGRDWFERGLLAGIGSPAPTVRASPLRSIRGSADRRDQRRLGGAVPRQRRSAAAPTAAPREPSQHVPATPTTPAHAVRSRPPATPATVRTDHLPTLPDPDFPDANYALVHRRTPGVTFTPPQHTPRRPATPHAAPDAGPADARDAARAHVERRTPAASFGTARRFHRGGSKTAAREQPSQRRSVAATPDPAAAMAPVLPRTRAAVILSAPRFQDPGVPNVGPAPGDVAGGPGAERERRRRVLLRARRRVSEAIARVDAVLGGPRGGDAARAAPQRSRVAASGAAEEPSERSAPSVDVWKAVRPSAMAVGFGRPHKKRSAPRGGRGGVSPEADAEGRGAKVARTDGPPSLQPVSKAVHTPVFGPAGGPAAHAAALAALKERRRRAARIARHGQRGGRASPDRSLTSDTDAGPGPASYDIIVASAFESRASRVPAATFGAKPQRAAWAQKSVDLRDYDAAAAQDAIARRVPGAPGFAQVLGRERRRSDPGERGTSERALDVRHSAVERRGDVGVLAWRRRESSGGLKWDRRLLDIDPAAALDALAPRKPQWNFAGPLPQRPETRKPAGNDEVPLDVDRAMLRVRANPFAGGAPSFRRLLPREVARGDADDEAGPPAAYSLDGGLRAMQRRAPAWGFAGGAADRFGVDEEDAASARMLRLSEADAVNSRMRRAPAWGFAGVGGPVEIRKPVRRDREVGMSLELPPGMGFGEGVVGGRFDKVMPRGPLGGVDVNIPGLGQHADRLKGRVKADLGVYDLKYRLVEPAVRVPDLEKRRGHLGMTSDAPRGPEDILDVARGERLLRPARGRVPRFSADLGRWDVAPGARDAADAIARRSMPNPNADVPLRFRFGRVVDFDKQVERPGVHERADNALGPGEYKFPRWLEKLAGDGVDFGRRAARSLNAPLLPADEGDILKLEPTNADGLVRPRIREVAIPREHARSAGGGSAESGLAPLDVSYAAVDKRVLVPIFDKMGAAHGIAVAAAPDREPLPQVPLGRLAHFDRDGRGMHDWARAGQRWREERVAKSEDLGRPAGDPWAAMDALRRHVPGPGEMRHQLGRSYGAQEPLTAWVDYLPDFAPALDATKPRPPGAAGTSIAPASGGAVGEGLFGGDWRDLGGREQDAAVRHNPPGVALKNGGAARTETGGAGASADGDRLVLFPKLPQGYWPPEGAGEPFAKAVGREDPPEALPRDGDRLILFGVGAGADAVRRKAPGLVFAKGRYAGHATGIYEEQHRGTIETLPPDYPAPAGAGYAVAQALRRQGEDRRHRRAAAAAEDVALSRAALVRAHRESQHPLSGPEPSSRPAPQWGAVASPALSSRAPQGPLARAVREAGAAPAGTDPLHTRLRPERALAAVRAAAEAARASALRAVAPRVAGGVPGAVGTRRAAERNPDKVTEAEGGWRGLDDTRRRAVGAAREAAGRPRVEEAL